MPGGCPVGCFAADAEVVLMYLDATSSYPGRLMLFFNCRCNDISLGPGTGQYLLCQALFGLIFNLGMLAYVAKYQAARSMATSFNNVQSIT